MRNGDKYHVPETPRALNAEAGDAVSVLAGLEEALNRRSIQDRVAETLALTDAPAR